ncbi:hypothetical protein GRAN_3802 [Granulicella sibirica]|uniref:Uncharacterized protein n=1 Tax=Granulicella sibirica TaxID=2479048 RepID=A0A4Q0SYJ5_9BACT|nr:hypothetical protein GRAN_3802 [Granulicella sibirica]
MNSKSGPRQSPGKHVKIQRFVVHDEKHACVLWGWLII